MEAKIVPIPNGREVSRLLGVEYTFMTKCLNFKRHGPEAMLIRAQALKNTKSVLIFSEPYGREK